MEFSMVNAKIGKPEPRVILVNEDIKRMARKLARRGYRFTVVCSEVVLMLEVTRRGKLIEQKPLPNWKAINSTVVEAVERNYYQKGK